MSKPDQATSENHDSLPPVSSMNDDLSKELLRTKMLESPSRPGQIGKIGRFEIIHILGVGGMGEVLLANEPLTDTKVALKMIKPELRGQVEVKHRFLTEARHMYQMNHPNVLKVLEVCERSEGHYYVMPYIKSGSLRNRLVATGGALAADEISTIAVNLAEALKYAHNKGIIHRDLKPENVLLDEHGQVYLTDFGLVRTVFNDNTVNVQKHSVEGTPAYMSPGVAKGNAEDTRCDIYAFGALLYEMLTGVPPYQGENAEEIIQKIIADAPKPILEINPDAPKQLVKIAEKAMARELRDRYAEMADALEDLRALDGLDAKPKMADVLEDLQASVPEMLTCGRKTGVKSFIDWVGLISVVVFFCFAGYCILFEKPLFEMIPIFLVCCLLPVIFSFLGMITVKVQARSDQANKDGIDVKLNSAVVIVTDKSEENNTLSKIVGVLFLIGAFFWILAGINSEKEFGVFMGMAIVYAGVGIMYAGSFCCKDKKKNEIQDPENEKNNFGVKNFIGWVGLLVSVVVIFYFGGYGILLEKSTNPMRSIGILCIFMPLIFLFSGMIKVKGHASIAKVKGLDVKEKYENEQSGGICERQMLVWKKIALGVLGCILFGVFMGIRDNFANIWIRASCAAIAFAVLACLFSFLSAKAK